MAGYGFSMPDRIKEILELAQQSQPAMAQLTNPQPQPQEPQETPDGKDIVNKIFAPPTQQTPPQAPNPYELGELRNILSSKVAYNAANTLSQNPAAYAKTYGLTEDAVRALAGGQMQNAHNSAEMSRARLNAGGFNTDGYSALDDTLEGVQNQLLSREAKDITEAFNGAYSKTTDQYYERKYIDALANGLSPRRAKRLAGYQAREYQANRVAYLDGLYNSYGHNDAGVTSNIGMQILGMIAQDNPTLANLYAKVYPTPMNEYNTANDIAKEATKQGYLERLAEIEQANALQRIFAELGANKDFATHEYDLKARNDEAIAKRHISQYADEKAIDMKAQIQLEEYKARAALEKIQKEFESYREIARKFLDPDKLKTWEEAYFGLTEKGEQRGQANRATAKDSSHQFMAEYTKMIEAIDKRIKEEQARLVEGDDEASKKHNAEIQAKIQELEQQREWAYGRFQDVAEATREIPEFNGNEMYDVKVAEIIRNMAEAQGYTDEQIRNVIYNEVKTATGNAEYAKRIAGIGMH